MVKVVAFVFLEHWAMIRFWSAGVASFQRQVSAAATRVVRPPECTSPCSECTILDNLAHNMQATYVDIVIVPMYQEWRLKCAEAALEQARAERTRREAWANEFPDTRRLVSEVKARRHSVIVLS